MNNLAIDHSGGILYPESDRVTLLLSEINEKLTLQNVNEKQCLSIDELSVLIGIPKGTIYKMTSKRIIPFVKIGKHLIFMRDEIFQWIKSKQKETLTKN